MKSIWTITTADGQTVGESPSERFFWPDIDPECRIAILEVAGHVFEGFEEYGFQRVGGAPVGGQLATIGFQVLCKRGDGVVAWTLEGGRCHTRLVPEDAVTYNPEYWRKGA